MYFLIIFFWGVVFHILTCCWFRPDITTAVDWRVKTQALYVCPSAPFCYLVQVSSIIEPFVHLIRRYSLLIRHYSLLIRHYRLLIIHYSLLIRHYNSFAVRSLVRSSLGRYQKSSAPSPSWSTKVDPNQKRYLLFFCLYIYNIRKGN